MDFINFEAGEIYDEISNEGLSVQNALNLIKEHAANFYNNERVVLLENIRNKFQATYDEHLKVCKAEVPTECETNKWHIKLLHFLNQEIKMTKEITDTAIPDDRSDFTVEERRKSDARIDELFKNLQELKTGQEIIWTDLMNELSELKEMYYLNKKNWRQLLTGKLTEMVSAGVVSETISKKIAGSMNPVFDRLLE